MSKISWKPGNMLYPLPVVLVSCCDGEGKDNLLTVAWTGTICSEPPMVYISVRKERHSYKMIEKTKEFVINLTTKDLAFATDFCGVRSGKDIDKWKEMNLTREASKNVSAPSVKESPVNIECKVTDIMPLGSHDMFIAKVVGVSVDDAYMKDNRFDLKEADPIVYSHGEYYGLDDLIGKFGYSVKKNK